jgi:uncharacterized protein YkwD
MKKIVLWLFPMIFIAPLSIAQSSLRMSETKFKKAFLDRINDLRQRGCNCGDTYMPPVGAIKWNDELTAAAKEHTIDMSRRHYFSHESLDGRDLRARVTKAGYTYKGYHRWAVGENIAQGQRNIDEVMDGWIKSEGHCKNLMNAQFKEIGIYEYNYYWTQDFGGRVSF